MNNGSFSLQVLLTAIAFYNNRKSGRSYVDLLRFLINRLEMLYRGDIISRFLINRLEMLYRGEQNDQRLVTVGKNFSFVNFVIT